MRLLLTMTLLLLCFSSAFAKDDITKELITSNGKTRAYYLYVPSTVKAPNLAPLIVMLHGSNRTGVTLVEKWKDYAKKEGIILAGPDATNLRGWGLAAGWTRFPARPRGRVEDQIPDQSASRLSLWPLCRRNLRDPDVSDGITILCRRCGSRRRA